jgi:hypothetical protein
MSSEIVAGPLGTDSISAVMRQCRGINPDTGQFGDCGAVDAVQKIPINAVQMGKLGPTTNVIGGELALKSILAVKILVSLG